MYVDRNADGRSTPDEVLSGVSVQLARDNGDGVYNALQDTVVSTLTTDAAGQYCFGDLDPDSSYFVLRPAQVINGESLRSVVSPLISGGQPGTLIDQFVTRQTATAVPPAPSSNGSILTFADESEVIGRERDLNVELIQGIGEVALAVNPFGLEDLLEFRNSPGTIGTRIVTWDGIDGDSDQIAGGLHSRDLTMAGQNTGVVLRGGVDASGADTELEIRLHKSGVEGYSQVTFQLPVNGGNASGYVFLPFDTFTGPVDPTNVDAIQLVISRGGQGTDGKIALIGASGPKQFDIPEVIRADLSVTKTNNANTLLAGASTTYTIVVTNNGPDDVSGAVFEDTFSSNL
ncbi:MAG: DUF11 domain-containing protein, partial [Planctomycetales bacterium]|nr:DUF11 domain-containing protein [Planctomycetales bacterium]